MTTRGVGKSDGVSFRHDEVPHTRELTPTASGFEETMRPPKREWPDPTPEMLASPEFNAVWQCIKGWDIDIGDGPSGATGNHVRAILDALAAIEPTALELGKAARAVR